MSEDRYLDNGLNVNVSNRGCFLRRTELKGVLQNWLVAICIGNLEICKFLEAVETEAKEYLGRFVVIEGVNVVLALQEATDDVSANVLEMRGAQFFMIVHLEVKSC